MSQRYEIVDAKGRRVRTLLDAPQGIVLSPDDTFSTHEEAFLCLLFTYPAHLDLRTAPVTIPLPIQPRIVS